MSSIALILMLAFSAVLLALPAASAHTPPWTIKTHVYLSAIPNPVGVNQDVFMVMWSSILMPGATINNDVRMENYRINVTKPNGDTETIVMPNTDPTSTSYAKYTPDQVGTYSFVAWHPDLVYRWNDTGAMRTWTNDTFLGATSKTVFLTVQEDPLPAAISSYPLPTEYWTRPIEGQNTAWYEISSNWLGHGSPQIHGNSWSVQPDGIAPNSPHIMWTKPIQDGGVVGGTNVGVDGNTFYQGGSYNHRYRNPIIMYGRIYYEEPFGISGNRGDVVCVDLRTGEEIWRRDDLPTLEFGYYYDADTPNQHGVFYEGILFDSSGFGTENWRAFDPRTGDPLFNVTNVPSVPTVSQTTGGAWALGPKGEQLRYVIQNAGNSTNPDWRLLQWNSSKLWNLEAFTPNIPASVDASTPNRFDWNVPINSWRSDMPSAVVVASFPDDVMLGYNGTLPYWTSQSTEYTMWAISLKPESRGDLVWMETYTVPEGIAIQTRPADGDARVFTIYHKETLSFYGYSLDNGTELWGPVEIQEPFSFFGGAPASHNNRVGPVIAAYGNLYVSGYGGVLYCIDLKTGTVEWTYGNGGEGNSTLAPLGIPWGNFPVHIGAIADGKVYLFTNEHSPNTPQYKGALIRAIDAITGEEIWTLSGWGEGESFMGGNGAVASGYYTYLNTYDMQIYTVGKGPSATSVMASPKISVQGSSVLIEGTVLDIAAGTKQDEQAARFPNGVPAVSDDSMRGWMEYVYMQKPMQTDIVGVDVVLSIRDPNGNFHDMTVTTDASGAYTLMWQPPVPGTYTVFASFEGSESYWPSRAETAFGVDQAPSPGGPIESEPPTSPTPTPTESPSPSPTGSPSPSPTVTPAPFPTEIAIIAVVVVASGLGIVAYWFLRKR